MPAHDASLTGEIRAPASHIQPMVLDERRIIAYRAMLEIGRPHTIVNLGIGMPEVGGTPAPRLENLGALSLAHTCSLSLDQVCEASA
jgi:hypothetical protein